VTSPNSSRNIFTYRAYRALALGTFAMVGAAWLVSVPAVLGALAGGIIPATLSPRARRLRTPLLITLACAAVGAFVASLWFGHGTKTARLLAGLIATFAAGPWLVVVGFIRWVRARVAD
jgi:MFS-type transporter involved in bile tolerance (Atg22 family)